MGARQYLSVLFKILRGLERLFARWQGKGWGAIGVEYEVKMVSRLLSEPKICIDVGGNVGNYSTALLEQFPNCQIVIFEPSQKNLLILEKEFASNVNVSIEPAALSKDSGFTTLFSDTYGSVLASLTKRNLNHLGIPFDFTEQVKTLRFEDFWVERLHSSKIDLLKLDIEGYEFQALEGCGESIRHINVIQFEFGGTQIDTRAYLRDFWVFLIENGFELFRISPIGLIKMQAYDESDECFTLTTYLAKNLNY